LKINNIRSELDSVTVSGRITSIGIKSIVRTRYGEATAARSVLEDDTGGIMLNLWRGQIDLVREGDVVRVENAFVRNCRDQLEPNVGSRGRKAVLSRTGASL